MNADTNIEPDSTIHQRGRLLRPSRTAPCAHTCPVVPSGFIGTFARGAHRNSTKVRPMFSTTKVITQMDQNDHMEVMRDPPAVRAGRRDRTIRVRPASAGAQA